MRPAPGTTIPASSAVVPAAHAAAPAVAASVLQPEAPALEALYVRVDEIVDEITRHLVETRHMFHMYPEVAWGEKETTAEIRRFLAELGLPYDASKGRDTGTIVDIVGAPGGPVVGYRADIDALPIHDLKAVPYRSRRDGVMHACGHDAHAAVALGLAEVLHRLGADLPGTARIVFQPAEEVADGGARVMVGDGAAEGLAGMWAIHVDPTLEPRTFGLREGTLTAAVDGYVVRIHGVSSHSARPHLGVDAIMLAARCITAIYQTVQTTVDPYKTGVLNVGRLRGGEASNIIADCVEFEGTIRSFEPEVRVTLRDTVEKVVRGSCEPFGARVEFAFTEGPPSVRNDPTMIALADAAILNAIGPAGAVRLTRPSTGGDDFSMYGSRVPTCMLRAGARVGEGHGLHTPLFDVADETIPSAVRVMARCIIADLVRHRRAIAAGVN